jgi:DNA polymerase elongation subunit (family B)
LYGKSILYRGVEDGKRVARRIEYRPTFYVPAKTKTKFKTLQGDYVESIEPGNINDAREFLERYKEVETFPIYGNNKYDYAFISDEFPEDIFWDKDQIVIAYLDIEVGSENGFPEPKEASEEITAITMKIGNKIYSYGVGAFTSDNPDLTYKKCRDEIELINQFINDYTLIFPDIITGWNVKFFDIPYLVNRITRVLGEAEANKLSPWKKLSLRETTIMNREHISYDIFGVSVLDYLELYKKYSFTPQESYRLDHVAFSELGQKKLDYSEYENLHQLYKHDFQKFMEYNIKDVELVERLNDKGRLIELAMTLAYDNKVNYDDVFSQVRMWDTIIYNHLKKNNIVIPQMKQGEKNAQYEGAYVKDPIVGLHNWVASFDLNSLYPHLIMQYNISPETLVQPAYYDDEIRNCGSVDIDSILDKRAQLDFLKQKKLTVTPNRQFFSTNKQGFLPKIMETMYKDRSKYKKLALEAKKKIEKVKGDPAQVEYLEKEISRYNNLQLAKKVSLNSAYGAIGNQYFRFFDIRIAEAITISGQLSTRWIERRMNAYINTLLKTDGVDYVIACDTDSMYLNLSGIVDKVIPNEKDHHKVIRFLDKVCEEKLQKVIDASYKELAEYVNAFDQKMIMKRETLADKAIWTAKKRYILNAYNVEGVEYAEPKLKITGLEAVKSSTPSACREKIKEALKVIMTGSQDDVINFIEDFRDQFKKLPVEEISFPRSVNGVTEYHDALHMFKKGTPIHVKGVLVYNHLVREMKLEKKFQLIKEGEKIKFCYLKQPNPFRNNTIAFLNSLPKDLGVDQFIDYETQFEKSFVEPLKIILDAIKWRSARMSTLEDLFG